MTTDLSIYEGEYKSWKVTVSTSDGNPVDITGFSFLFTVKRDIGDDDSNAIIKKLITTLSDPTNGSFHITMDESDTANKNGRHVYDLQMKDTLGHRTALRKNSRFTVEQRVGDNFS